MSMNKPFIIAFLCTALGVIIGYLLPHTYLGKTATQWSQEAETQKTWATQWKENYLNTSNKLTQLQRMPTPTPIVEYQTQYQYIPQDTRMRCYSYGYNNEFTNCTSN